MIEGSEKRKCQLGFELQSLRVFKKCSMVLCHKYIALVGKFCTEIITYRRVMKISNKFHYSRSTNCNNLLSF